jgi:amidophosphoribosyltransferase
MSDAIQHECGIALVRLRKPLEYYLEKYGTAFYGLNKMYLLMEKQHNRGQDGAGLASIKLNMPPGQRYLSRYRSIDGKPIADIFGRIQKRIDDALSGDASLLKNAEFLKNNVPALGEVYLGHLRYGTYGKNAIEACHPFLRQSNYKSRNLILAGNFNMTNVDELFEKLVGLGQSPKEKADTVTILEKIGHFLDKENAQLYDKAKQMGLSKPERAQYQEEHLNIPEILRRASKRWDGGYAMVGMIGQGDSFVLRDPHGIRPAYYYFNDEVAVVASERPVIQTAFDASFDSVHELPAGHAFWVKANAEVEIVPVLTPGPRSNCSFERIYFSRGNDAEIYQERLSLGRQLADSVLQSVGYDVDNTVFSFIPNTAEVAFYGLVKGVEDYIQTANAAALRAQPDLLNQPDALKALLNRRPRVEKVAWKDARLRTFITEDSSRDDLVAHIYDSTYEVVRPTDNLVVLDDSIVRGTTLRQSILKMLDRLQPKTIHVVSSAPQIRFPDCYGIDMAKMGDFIAFQAAMALHKERGSYAAVVEEAFKNALHQLTLPKEEQINAVLPVYATLSVEDINGKIAQLLTPEGVQAQVVIHYQSIEGLHRAIPQHPGDWYFTGNYPTPGGTRVANRAFVNYMQGKNQRAY